MKQVGVATITCIVPDRSIKEFGKALRLLRFPLQQVKIDVYDVKAGKRIKVLKMNK